MGDETRLLLIPLIVAGFLDWGAADSYAYDLRSRSEYCARLLNDARVRFDRSREICEAHPFSRICGRTPEEIFRTVLRDNVTRHLEFLHELIKHISRVAGRVFEFQLVADRDLYHAAAVDSIDRGRETADLFLLRDRWNEPVRRIEETLLNQMTVLAFHDGLKDLPEVVSVWFLRMYHLSANTENEVEGVDPIALHEATNRILADWIERLEGRSPRPDLNEFLEEHADEVRELIRLIQSWEDAYQEQYGATIWT